MKYKKLAKFLGALTVVAVLMSVALTFAHPYQSAMKEEASTETHEECEEIMEQMHEEYTNMMSETHHEMHQTNHTRMHNEDVGSHESHGRHGCH
jgi:Na+/H+ antiporter NhaB